MKNSKYKADSTYRIFYLKLVLIYRMVRLTSNCFYLKIRFFESEDLKISIIVGISLSFDGNCHLRNFFDFVLRIESEENIYKFAINTLHGDLLVHNMALLEVTFTTNYSDQLRTVKRDKCHFIVIDDDYHALRMFEAIS